MIAEIAISALAAAGILYAYWKSKITSDAIISAVVMGLAIYYCLGIYWAGILVAFFFLGNIANKYGYETKARQRIEQKTRNTGNVLGNGGSALIFSLLYCATGNFAFVAAYLGAMASACADTFATEIGQIHGRKPVMLTSLRRVPVGTSGGVTSAGFGASLLGAFGISVLAAFFGYPELVIVGTLAGFVGSVADSFFGCVTEQRFRLANNHTTNLLGTFFGGLSAVVFWVIFL